jgi:hypothetical protein
VLADLRQAGQTVCARHPQVEQDEIGIRTPDEREYLRSGGRLADDFEVLGLVQRPLDSFYDQLVIVGYKNAHDWIVDAEPDVSRGPDG